MKRFVIGMATAGLALCFGTPVEAQLHGYPVYAWTAGSGFTLSGDFGRGLNDASGKSNAFGGRLGITLPIVSVWAGGGTVDLQQPGVGNELTFGGGVAIKVFDPPLVPVAISFQTGAGYLGQTIDVLGSPEDLSALKVPLGIAFAFNPPTPGLTVQPWVAPRVEYLRTSFAGTSNSNFGFGASAGLNVTLPAGLGWHFAVDWMSIGDPTVRPLVFGTGLHYTIPLPGIPMM